MNGRQVFRFATRVIVDSVQEVVAKAGLTMADVALIVPHQANVRIIETAAKRLKVPEEVFISTWIAPAIRRRHRFPLPCVRRWKRGG